MQKVLPLLEGDYWEAAGDQAGTMCTEITRGIGAAAGCKRAVFEGPNGVTTTTWRQSI